MGRIRTEKHKTKGEMEFVKERYKKGRKEELGRTIFLRFICSVPDESLGRVMHELGDNVPVLLPFLLLPHGAKQKENVETATPQPTQLIFLAFFVSVRPSRLTYAHNEL